MKQLFLLLFCCLVSPVFAQNAIPFCTKMSTRVHVRTHPGNTEYVTLYSRNEFLKKAEVPYSPYTLGLTRSILDVEVETNPKLEEQAGQICVALSDVIVTLHYPKLIVYIDKKYPPSSCEYKTIREHENYHVAVAQEALSFFRQDVEDVVSKAVMKLSPKIVRSRQDIMPVVTDYNSSVKEALRPIVNHINKVLVKKNQAIDTREMYENTTAVCPNW